MIGIGEQVAVDLGAIGEFRIVPRHRKIGESIAISGTLGSQSGIAVGWMPYAADRVGFLEHADRVAAVAQYSTGYKAAKACPNNADSQALHSAGQPAIEAVSGSPREVLAYRTPTRRCASHRSKVLKPYGRSKDLFATAAIFLPDIHEPILLSNSAVD